jgi:hypothetical protein
MSINDDVFTLFGGDDGLGVEIQPVTPVRMKGSKEQGFEAFHLANPHVYKAIVKIALDLKTRGFQRGSIWLVFNRLRWLYAIQTVGDDYRLNNNFTGYYSRLVMATIPALDGFFETRLHKGQDPYVPDLETLGFPSKREETP